MRILSKCFSIVIAGVLLALSQQANAGKWDIWVDKLGNGEVVVAASFSGDALTEDTQVDLKVNSGFSVVDVQTLVEGSVCGAFPSKGFIRAVPPSGAGVALGKSVSDTCIFTLKLHDKAAFQRGIEDIIQLTFIECESSTDGSQPCTSQIRSLAATKGEVK